MSPATALEDVPHCHQELAPRALDVLETDDLSQQGRLGEGAGLKSAAADGSRHGLRPLCLHAICYFARESSCARPGPTIPRRAYGAGPAAGSSGVPPVPPADEGQDTGAKGEVQDPTPYSPSPAWVQYS